MKRILAVCTTALEAVGLVVGGASVASATGDHDVCVPADAYTEVIEHPAIGEPTVEVDNPAYVAPTYAPGFWEHVKAVYTPAVGTPTIEVEIANPDYVPATPDQPGIIHHEAETTVVHHEAVTHTEWKYSLHGGRGFLWLDNDTFKYIQNGQGFNEKPAATDGDFYERTQHTQTVTDVEAWDETVVIKEAWDEPIVTPGTPAEGEPTIIATQANPDYEAPTYVAAYKVWVMPVYTPPVGTPTIVVDNPEYVAPRTEDIEHEAVECPAPVVPDEEEKPVAPVKTAASLPVTGGGMDLVPQGLIGLFLTLAGAATLVARKAMAAGRI